MRKLLALAVVIAAITIPAFADTYFVKINDLLDSPPVVDTNLPPWLNGQGTVTGFEMAEIHGLIPFPVTAGPPVPPIPIGVTAMILDEPSQDPFGPRQSDYVILTTDQLQTPNGLFETILIQFRSDGASDFNVLLPTGTSVPHLLETGDWQDVSAELGIPAGAGLTVSVVSDLATVETPEPSSMLLLASGTGGLIILLRRRLRR